MRKVAQISITIPEGRSLDAETLLKQLSIALRGRLVEAEETFHIFGEGVVMNDGGQILFQPPKPKVTRRGRAGTHLNGLAERKLL